MQGLRSLSLTSTSDDRSSRSALSCSYGTASRPSPAGGARREAEASQRASPERRAAVHRRPRARDPRRTRHSERRRAGVQVGAHVGDARRLHGQQRLLQPLDLRPVWGWQVVHRGHS
jgi:hypothetical protein